MTRKKSRSSAEITQQKPVQIETDLDPALQEIILKARSGEEIDSTFAASLPDGTIVVDVLAKLQDPKKPVPGLNVIRHIGQIVTGTIEVNSIEAVRGDANVMSLKRAKRVHKQLEFSVPEINASQEVLNDSLPPTASIINGAGVIVGVVDYGCDFRHFDFRKENGTTRLLFLWDQRGGHTSLSPAGFDYGREFDAQTINSALAASNPYVALGYNPSSGSHGTHVMSIAAGNERAPGSSSGVAPSADLIFVQIDASDFDDEESFGNSRKLLEAVDYIFTKAQARGQSAAINISLGTHGGPHDGSTLAEQGFDELLAAPGRALVISAGNSWQRRAHATGSVSKSSSRILGWIIEPTDQTENELEVWYSGQAELSVALITPSGNKLAPVPLGTTVTLENVVGETTGRIFHRRHDPNNGDNQINVLLEASAPAGEWGIELSTQSIAPIGFHAWIERDDQGQSAFALTDSDPSYTIGSVSCGKRTIAVGSYLSGVPDRELSPFTSEGPTRDGRHGIRAAKSGSQGTTRMSGTSMASPHVAGLIALVMQAADEPLTAEQIRQGIIDSARHSPPPGSGWHSRYGFGRVDALVAVKAQIPLPPVVAAPIVPVPASALAPNGTPSILHELVSKLAEAARIAQGRVRLQIEVEPTNRM